MSDPKEHWNRSRSIADYRKEHARNDARIKALRAGLSEEGTKELAALAGAWFLARSPGKRRVAKEKVIKALLRVIELHDPEGFPIVKAAVEAQAADRPLPRVAR